MALTTTPLRSTAARRPAPFAALALAAATALAAFSSQPVLAQQPASPAPVAAAVADGAPDRPMQLRAGSERQRLHRQNKEQRMERWQQRRAQHMEEVKAGLQLTPQQATAWADFTAAMQPGPRHAQLDALESMENLTTPERIDRMRAMRIQRAAQADQQGDAVKRFYAMLSAPQQKTFDQQMHRMQQPMHQDHMGGPVAKSLRGSNKAQGARGAQHRSGQGREGMQRRYQYGADRANPSAAPDMPATAPAQ